MRSKEIKSIALCAIICALSVLFIVLGGIFDMLDITAAAIASAFVAFCAIEMGEKYPYLVFAVSAALSLILCPGRTSTLYYVFFLGYYPIIRVYLDRLSRWVGILLKFIIFNVALLLMVFLAKSVFLADSTTYSVGIVIALFVFANVFFLVYDIAFNVISVSYKRYFRKRLKIDTFFDK